MIINKRKNAIRNALWGYISKVICIILPFIFRTVLIKYMNDQYLGLNSLFNSILQVLNLSELGFSSAIVYSMYKPIANNDTSKINALLKFYKKIYKYVGLTILTFGIIISPFIKLLINGEYPSEINIYIVFMFFLLNTVIGYLLFGYRLSLINAFQRNDLELKVTLFSTIFLYLVSSIIIIITKNYYCYLVVLITSTAINNLIIYFVTKKHFNMYKCDGSITDEEKRTIKKNVIALLFHKIGATVLNSADNIVISAFLGLTLLAKYTNYYYIMNSVTNLIAIMFVGLTGGLGNSLIINSKEKNNELFNKVLFFNAYLTIISTAMMFSLYQDFIELWIGKQYLFNYKIMIIFCAYFFIHTIRRTIIVFRDAAGLWWENKFQPIISAIFNLVLNIILVNIIGIYGILISSILAMVIIDIPIETIKYYKNKMIDNYRVYFRKIFMYFITTAFILLVLNGIEKYIEFNLIINLIIKAVISVAVTVIVVYILYGRTNEYKYIKELIKIRKKKHEVNL